MKVSKVLIIDEQDNYLMMWRSNHPNFPNDPDLPGGTIEADESPEVAAVREVKEEAGILITPSELTHLYTGTEYSTHQTEYSLYMIKVPARPTVTISWEHSSYEWLPRDKFLNAAKNASDTYMHMVHDVVTGL